MLARQHPWRCRTGGLPSRPNIDAGVRPHDGARVDNYNLTLLMRIVRKKLIAIDNHSH